MIPKFLKNMINTQYGEEIAKQILQGYEAKRSLTFRVNTIKANSESIENELIKLGIEFEKVPWSIDAFVIKNIKETEIEKLEIYEQGKIYVQSLSSMLPAIILEPKPNTDILDMTAAPGGKTTQMSALTQNKAHITACEMNKIRAERLKYNVEMQGASSVYVMIKDSRRIDDFFAFDNILLDSPCSGSGTLNASNPKLEKYFTEKLIEKSVSAQWELLKKAIKILKPGHEMVYSTCSILAQENEDIVNKALSMGNIEIVPIEFEGKNSLPILLTKIEGTLSICPNDLYEGFFVAKLKKK